MDTETASLFGAIALLVINQALLRLPGFDRRPWLFWPVQVVNFAAACALSTWGLPGMEGGARVANVLLALLFVYHIVMNNQRLVAARRTAREAEDAALEAKKARMVEAIRASDAAAEARDGQG